MAAFEKIISGDDLILKNRYGLFSKKELEAQLKEGHLTVGELGSLYNLKEYQIIHVLKSLEIIYRNDLNDTRIFDATIDNSLHQVLLDTLLGDAYMTDKSYLLGHGLSQYDYCYHIAERLHQFVASIGDFNVKAQTKKSINFWTYRHNIFSPYFDRFYSHGIKKKYFTEKTAPDLESEGLAYWYMDDGKYSKYGAYLCVGNISIEEGNILIDLLKRNFSISSNLQKYDAKKNSYAIYIQAKSRKHFYDLISSYIISSMRYKITGSRFPRIAFIRELIISRHLKLCEKAKRYIRYFGDEVIQKENLKNNIFLDSKIEYINRIKSHIKERKMVSRNIKKDILKKELVELFNEGFSDQQIADMYDVGRNKIAFFRRSFDIIRKSSWITKAKEEQLKELFSDPDMTIQRVMKELHISFYKVKNWMNNNHV